MDERTGKHQTLLLSAGELVHLRIAFVGDPELLQKLPGSSVRGSQGDPEVSRVEDEVLSRVEVSIRIRSLRNDADPAPDEHRLPPPASRRRRPPPRRPRSVERGW